MASCVSCNDGKNKKNVTCCGGTVTETTTKVTKTGGALCEMPTGAVQYIGARYVPVFADPIEWSADRPYEHLMMVQHEGNTYMSRQAVPVGVALDNGEYWAFMSAWNAQIEQYREEVETFDGRITANEGNIESLQSADETHDAQIEQLQQEDNELNNRTTDLEAGLEDITTTPVIVIIGDSWSDGTDEWAALFANQLQGRYNVINTSRPGVGFRVGSKNFPVQSSTDVDAAMQAAGYRNKDVTHVFVVGGVNDYRNGYTAQELFQSVDDTFTNLKDRFPQAKKYLAINCGVFTMMDDIAAPNKPANYGVFPTFQTLIFNRVTGYQGTAVNVLADFWLVLNRFAQDIDNVFSTDLLHPNATGARYIKNYFLAIVNGEEQKFKQCRYVQRTANVTIDGESHEVKIRQTVTTNGSLVNIQAIVQFPNTINPQANTSFDVETFGFGIFGNIGNHNLDISAHDYASTIPVTAYWRVSGTPTASNPVGNRFFRIYLKQGSAYRDIYLHGSYDMFETMVPFVS